MLSVPLAARAGDASAIYRIDDIPGEIHLSDSATAAPGVLVTRVVETMASNELRPGRATSTPTAAPRAARFIELIAGAAAAQHLDPDLLQALIAVESDFRPDAISYRGASGLTQLMPSTSRDYGVTDIFDPRQNINAGARHLRWLLDRYGQDTGRALAAYNAGAGAIERSLAHTTSWPSAETALYVERVLARYAALRQR